jgi:hypothetical protein
MMLTLFRTTLPESDSRPGYLILKLVENTEIVRTLKRNARVLSLWTTAKGLNFNKEIVTSILTEILGRKKVCANMMPRSLIDDPLQRGEVCSDLLQWIDVSDEWLNGVITAEESWVIQYGLEPKRHSIQWKSRSSNRPNKERTSITKPKTMKICIFDGYEIIHRKFAPPGQNVNQKYCLSFGTSETAGS